jgi:hypothetical protein
MSSERRTEELGWLAVRDDFRNEIIQALAPVIGLYISRAIATIQIQESTGTMTSSTTAVSRSRRNADSRSAGGRSAGVPADGMVITYRASTRTIRRPGTSVQPAQLTAAPVH